MGLASCCWKDTFFPRQREDCVTGTMVSLFGSLHHNFLMFDLIIRIKKLPRSWRFESQIMGPSTRIKIKSNMSRYVSFPLDLCISNKYVNQLCVCLQAHTVHTCIPHRHARSFPGFPADSRQLTHISIKHHCRATPGCLCYSRPLEKRDYVFKSVKSEGAGAGKGRGVTAT